MIGSILVRRVLLVRFRLKFAAMSLCLGEPEDEGVVSPVGLAGSVGVVGVMGVVGVVGAVGLVQWCSGCSGCGGCSGSINWL